MVLVGSTSRAPSLTLGLHAHEDCIFPVGKAPTSAEPEVGGTDKGVSARRVTRQLTRRGRGEWRVGLYACEIDQARRRREEAARPERARSAAPEGAGMKKTLAWMDSMPVLAVMMSESLRPMSQSFSLWESSSSLRK